MTTPPDTDRGAANAPDDELKASARLALACLDLTRLDDADTPADIEALCRQALGAPGPVAALCVWPRFVAQACAALPAGVKVAAVANFPTGSVDVDAALRDAEAILQAGGDEVDLVLPWRALVAGEHRRAAALVAAVRRATEGRGLKLILESGELPDDAAVRTASQIGLDEGVDFLKTSTGKTAHGASPEAARVMLAAIAAQPRPVGFKASGGVRTVRDAAGYAALVREALGPEALTPARLRFGASGLLGDILATLDGRPAVPPTAPGGY